MGQGPRDSGQGWGHQEATLLGPWKQKSSWGCWAHLGSMWTMPRGAAVTVRTTYRSKQIKLRV